MEAGYGHFVCSFWRLMEGDKTNKRQNEISFRRFGDLYNATKRTNNKTKWPQNLILSRCRSVVLAPCGCRQNEQVTTTNQTLIFRCNFVVLSFCRAVGKATKRRNEIHEQNEQSKIEKVPRGIRGEKSSKDMASSRNLVSTIGALASPKMGDGTRCPEG